jgi:hypothetical protein
VHVYTAAVLVEKLTERARPTPEWRDMMKCTPKDRQGSDFQASNSSAVPNNRGKTQDNNKPCTEVQMMLRHPHGAFFPCSKVQQSRIEAVFFKVKATLPMSSSCQRCHVRLREMRQHSISLDALAAC